MKKVLLLGALLGSVALAENLGVINVDSTTIDDKFASKSAEVSNIANITGKELESKKVENIQQVLNSVAGLTTEIQSGDSIKIHIRGIENQRFMGEKPGVAIVIDGVPVFERTGKVNIDLDNIESIKVVKGGASYLFGEDALSGAVIITTKKGAKNTKTYLASEVGSFGYSKFLARGGVNEDNYNFFLQGSTRSSDGYWQDADYRTDYLNGKLQYYIDDYSDVTVGFEKSDREKDSHGSVTGFTQADTNPESSDDGTGSNRDYGRVFDVDLFKLFTTYSRDLDKGNLLFNVYQYSDDTKYKSSPQKYDVNGDAVTDKDAYTTDNDYEQIQRGVKSEYRSSSQESAFMVGADFRANSYENRTKYLVDFKSSPFSPAVYSGGTVTGDNDTQEQMIGFYGEYKQKLSQDLIATFNYRNDNIKLDYSDRLNSLELDKTFNVNSYRLGATYKLNERTSFYTNTSTGFRTPTVSQLFSGKISPDGSTENNEDLKTEEAINIDIGVRGFTESFNYDLTLFQIEREDYIMSTTGQYAKPESGVSNRYENIGEMRNRGLELSLNTNNKKEIFFNLAYTYLDATFTKYDNYYLGLGNPYGRSYTTEVHNLAGNRVPRVSEHTLNLNTNYRVDNSLIASLEIFSRSDYYADELNRISISGYEVVNLLVTKNTKYQGADLEIFARVDNLFDKRYFNTARGYRDSDYDGDYDKEDLSLVVNEGIRYKIGIAAKF